MPNVQAQKGKVRGYAMIIDAHGMPVIDDPSTVPAAAWDKLSKKQQEHANAQVPSDKQYIT